MRLLQTKLQIPPSGSAVQRADLLRKLESAPQRKLLLVAAPAGFGKTTFTATWVDHLRRDVSNHIAWLSLDEHDNSLSRFLAYIIAALQKVSPHIGRGLSEALTSVEQFDPYAILTALLNDTAAWLEEQPDDHLYLVLDDYHFLETPELDEALRFMVDYVPAAMHIVVLTRIDPALPLAKLRAKGQLLEIRENDLRFTQTEAQAFFTNVINVHIRADTLSTLLHRTEGWITGLQLAGLTLQRTESPDDLFVQGITGTHRYIIDYLSDEVLQRLDDDIQQFLLYTSVLNTFSAELCNVVLEQSNSGQIINVLERENLFVVALDHQRQWYRYHQLFADMLRHRLRIAYPDRIPELHRRASAWYSGLASQTGEREAIDAAVHHGLSSGDVAAVLHILGQFVDSVWERGDHDTLRRWFGAIPHADLLSNSKLAIMDGWLHFTSGKYSEAEEILSHAVKESVQDDELHGRLLAVRAHLATFRGSPQETIGYAQQALGLLSRSTWWASAAIAYADALSLQGDSAAEGRYQEALNTPTRNIYLLLNAGFKLASSGRQNRALRQAYEVCSQSIALAEQHGLSQTTMAGCLYALRGDILCEWNRMAEALAQTAQAMDTITNNKHVGLIGWITIYRIRCLLAARRMDEAQAAFAHLDTLSLPLPIWLAKPLTALRALLWIAQGRTAELADWISAGRFSPSDPGLHMRSLEYLVYARVLMMQEQYDDARMILTQLTAHGDIRTRIAVMMPAQIMLTLIHLAQNRISEAEESLICAVNMGSNFGYLRTFLDGGKALIPLLREVWDAAPEYVDTLLSAFSEPLRTNTLPDPLSEREHEILRLVAAGLKNQEIADKLVISLNTVLYHNKNIFGKLGVEHRTQAVARARELSLI